MATEDITAIDVLCQIDLESPEKEIYLQIKLEKILKELAREKLNNSPNLHGKKDTVTHRLNVPKCLLDLRDMSAENPEFSEELTEEDLELLPVRADMWVGDMIQGQIAKIKEKAKAKKLKGK